MLPIMSPLRHGLAGRSIQVEQLISINPAESGLGPGAGEQSKGQTEGHAALLLGSENRPERGIRGSKPVRTQNLSPETTEIP